MNTIYSEYQKAFASGLTYYWGSLYGSSEALSLIEFDKGGKSWNRFTWQRILMNSISSHKLEKILFLFGWLISIPMSLLENRKFNGSCYTVIYQKIK